MAVFTLPESYKQHARYWAPPLVAGAAAWGAFMLIGHTPVLRASGLALVIIGLALALRPMGSVLTVIGGLALAFCPAFWAQTGGAEMLQPLEVAAAFGAALIGVIAVLLLSRRSETSILIGVLIFGALFVLAVGTPRSLRMTTLLSAWMLYLLTDALFAANPRPDSPPTGALGPQHTWGMLLLLALGIANDALFALMAPAVVLGLFLTGKRMPVWYWVILIAVLALGLRGLALQYADPSWWLYDPALAQQSGIRVPFVLISAWRYPERWIDLIQLVVYQFTAVGVALGVLGLARLSRWYPPIGVVMMIAFGTYALFGLVYFGADAAVLLMPMLMILVFWMTYAIYTISQWLHKSAPAQHWVPYLAPAAFTLLPMALLLRITGVI